MQSNKWVLWHCSIYATYQLSQLQTIGRIVTSLAVHSWGGSVGPACGAHVWCLAGVAERSRQLDEVSGKLCEFQEKAGELGHGLQRLEDKLASHDALGEAARNPRLLDRLQGMAREADELRRGLDRLRAFTDTWLAAVPSDCDTSHVRGQLDALARRHQQLTHDLQDRCGQLEEAGTVVAQYHVSVCLPVGRHSFLSCSWLA